MVGAQVEIKSLAKNFRETGRILDGIDLSVKSGEFVSLLGPSGCGKSTLLKLIAGLEKKDGGEIAVTLPDVTAQQSKPSQGFVFQESNLLPWRTVLDNAALPLELTGVRRVEARKRAEEVLHQVGLQDALRLFPVQLSGGMKMRVSVARALALKPQLLLLDEPFAALDEIVRQRLQEDLRSLWSEMKMTVLFVTHSISEAVFLSERIIMLSDRPAKILMDRKIDLPRAREKELRTDRAYFDQVADIGRIFSLGAAL